MLLYLLLALASVFAGPLDDTRELAQMPPRVAGQPGAAEAQGWALERFMQEGYHPQVLPGLLGGMAVTACQPGEGAAVWMVAHSDVAEGGAPGVIENAASVAALMEAAARVKGVSLPVRACFAVTDRSAASFSGARALASAMAAGSPPVVVIVVEQVGQGELVATGVDDSWGRREIGWLIKSSISVPYDMRTAASLFSTFERSDAVAFSEMGFPTVRITGRGEDGLYWAAESEFDDLSLLEPDTLREAATGLESLLRLGPPMIDGATGFGGSFGAAFELPWLPVAIPGEVTLVIVWVGIVFGLLAGLPFWRESLIGLAGVVISTTVGWGVVEFGTLGKPSHAALAEPLMLSWGVAVLAVLVNAPYRRGGVKGGALIAAWFALGLQAIHPLLALPWSMTAIALVTSLRFWPLLLFTVPFPLWVCSGETWRQLVFLGVLPADISWWMPIAGLSIWPLSSAILSLPRSRSILRDALFVVAALGIGSWNFFSAPYSDRYFEREMLTNSAIRIWDGME